MGRLNSSNKDASYGIIFHMRPEELGKFPERSVDVLWFVDLKNDRLDAAVRVLRLQHEVVQSKDLLVLNEMQKMLHPSRIIVRRDSQDDFHAGVFESMSPDGKVTNQALLLSPEILRNTVAFITTDRNLGLRW